MRSLNREYRGIGRVTDVLSFPMYETPGEFPEEGEFLLGDIVICPERAREQAGDYGATLDEEIRRLMVHGLLHLIGYDHEEGRAGQKEMEAKEGELLSAMQG